MLSLAWVSACNASEESLASTSFGKLAEEQSRGTRGTMASRQTGNTGMGDASSLDELCSDTARQQ